MLKGFVADHHADAKRVYISGFSNGAFFTYLLLSSRPDNISAIAPVAGLLSEKDAATAKPKPIFHVAGKDDPRVKFADSEKTIQLDLKLDHCDPNGKADGPQITEYSSDSGYGPMVVTMIHDGGHEVSQAAESWVLQGIKMIGNCLT